MLASCLTPLLGVVLTASGLTLAAPTTPAASPSATKTSPAASPTTSPTGSATPNPSATAPASSVVPCPRAKVKPIGPVPKPSPMPTHPLGRPAVGGDGLATTGLSVPDGAPALPRTVSAKSWVVADLDTGAVVGACGAHTFSPPASTQKLLLAQTVLPRLDPAQVITVTAADMDFEPGSSAVGLIRGGKYPVKTLWLGLLLNSGNDAANVLGRLGGGSGGLAQTIEDMNAEARRLGALDTHAETPSGLDGPGQVTSAYDLALITRALFARKDFRDYVATRTAKMPPQPPKDPDGFQIQTDNRLMYEYPGALGGKTGFTDLARHTYVGFAQRNGRRLVVTLLGAERLPVRAWEQGAALLDWGFATARDARVGRLVDPGEVDHLLDASPAPAIGARDGGTGPGTSTDAALINSVASVGALFVSVWFVVLLVSRHRRQATAARPRGGRAGPRGGQAGPPMTPLPHPRGSLRGRNRQR